MSTVTRFFFIIHLSVGETTLRNSVRGPLKVIEKTFLPMTWKTESGFFNELAFNPKMHDPITSIIILRNEIITLLNIKSLIKKKPVYNPRVDLT